LRTIVAEWVGDANPYVCRAAVAAICEPRLLTDPATLALRSRRAEEPPSRSPCFPLPNARLPACGICVRHWAIAGASRSPRTRMRRCPPSSDCRP